MSKGSETKQATPAQNQDARMQSEETQDKDARKAAALKALSGGCASMGSLAFAMSYPIDYIRSEFPTLDRKIKGQRLAYLDSAASALKSQMSVVLEDDFVLRHYSNIHRGVHTLSLEATTSYESARERIARYIGAKETREIVFTKGTTESLNLLAYSIGTQIFQSGKSVMLTELEHHANIVPWLRLAQAHGQKLEVVPIDEHGDLDLDYLYAHLDPEKIGAISITHLSNVLGTVVPVQSIVEKAREKGIITIIDAAQSAAHLPIDVQQIGCDFLIFSGHKCYGPTGIGVLYGRAALLEAMEPWQSGGDMINSVSFDSVSFAPIPHKFEAGTPPISQAIGLSAAIDVIEGQGLQRIKIWEDYILSYAKEQLSTIAGLRLIGEPKEQSSIISFVLDGIHPHDAGTLFDEKGVALRAGHHCAEPLIRKLGLPATLRLSIAMYTNKEDIDQLCEAIRYAQEVFA